MSPLNLAPRIPTTSVLVFAMCEISTFADAPPVAANITSS